MDIRTWDFYLLRDSGMTVRSDEMVALINSAITEVADWWYDIFFVLAQPTLNLKLTI